MRSATPIALAHRRLPGFVMLDVPSMELWLEMYTERKEPSVPNPNTAAGNRSKLAQRERSVTATAATAVV